VKLLDVTLSEIEDPGVTPYPDLTRSMERIGQRVAIIINRPKKKDAKHKIINGRRRVATALALGWDVIHAEVRSEDGRDRALTTLASNLVMKRNAATEAEAVEVLLRGGKNEKEIADETGFGLRIIRELTTLKKSLHPIAFDTLKVGGMTVTVAKRLLRLPTEGQAALVKSATDEDGDVLIRGKDVEASLRVFRNDMLSDMEQVIPPAFNEYLLLAGQLDGMAQRFSGKHRKLLIDTAAMLRATPGSSTTTETETEVNE